MGGDVGKNMNLFKFSRLGNQAFVKTLVENSGMNALIALVQELTEVMQLQQFHPLLDQNFHPFSLKQLAWIYFTFGKDFSHWGYPLRVHL